MIDLYHVNFHTFQNRLIFLDEAYARDFDKILSVIVAQHQIVQLGRAIMPTHVHVIIATFEDQPRGRIVQLLKGGSAHAFFQRYPLIGEELGGHLWQQTYQWVAITSHRQLLATIKYVDENLGKVGLGELETERPSASGEAPDLLPF